MSNQLSKFGAQPSKQPKYGILYTGRMSSGIWTQRSPLRDAGSTRVEEEFYGARGDALIDGLNCEVSAKLTFVRRPGSSVYNSNTYPTINRFYEWRLFNSQVEQIRVIADTASAIYDVTGPGTGNPSPTPLFVKSAGAGKTSFVGVGNNLYFSDGIDSEKIVGSLSSWLANTSFSAGQYIVDSNGNLQLNVGSQTATIIDLQIVGATSPRVASVFLSYGTPLDVPLGTNLTFSGLTTVPALNATTQLVTSVSSSYQFSFLSTLPAQFFAPETGAVTTGTGITGALPPVWNTGLGSITVDGGAQWVNRGSAVQTWGIATPVGVPSVTQAPVSSIYPPWASSTWYAPASGFIILDSGTFFRLTQAGTTGGSPPSWNTTLGATTADGGAIWTSLGAAVWQASHAYALSAAVQVTFTYYTTVQQLQSIPPGYWNGVFYYQYHNEYVSVQQQATATNMFQCVASGNSGPHPPSWAAGLGTTVIDGTVTWKNVGSAPARPGDTQALSLDSQILDANNNIQTAQVFGETGGSAPIWATVQGKFTPDNTMSWLNSGPFGIANTGAWIYAYSYKNSVTGHVSTADPTSDPITVTQGNLVVVQGIGSCDPQVDEIVIWRTVQGGSTLFYLDTIPNPGCGMTWTYYDSTPDTGLNELIEAPIAFSNNPPPTGLSALVYYLQRIWGAVNNSVYFSAGPDVTIGSGNEAWPPANVFVFPSTVMRLFPTSSGLLVFTVSDVYIIQGLGTQNSGFFSAPFLTNLGLVSYDAFSVNGSIVYMYTSDNQVVSLDPSSGVSEIGFPIGDQFGPNNGTGTFTPSSTQITWHIAGSQDKGLYVSDFNGTWWRLCPTPAPETGLTWSPMAQIIGGFSAVQSVEVLPGTHDLLIGPRTSGPILKRDYSVYSDHGSAYNAFAVLGSLVLAQPGQLALVHSITTDSQAIGTPLSLAIQLDEIAPISSGYFETLSIYEPDPPQLEPSASVYAQRFYVSQTQEPACCRHLQIQINWGTDTVKNELLSVSVYGGFDQEL